MAKSPKKKGFWRFIWRVIKWTIISFFASSLGLVLLFKFVPVPVTPLMPIRFFEQVFSEKYDVVYEHDWVSIDEISPHLLQAAVASEDQNFMTHSGFDWKAIDRAYKANKKGKRVKGASTISQQTAKNVFLWPARNYVRKGLEVYFTYLIELVWGKERILEVYLNSIEMGNGIYGAEMAAQTYFNKPAKKLTKAEAALIVATFPNPRRWSAGKPSGYIRKRQGWIMGQMNKIAPVRFE